MLLGAQVNPYLPHAQTVSAYPKTDNSPQMHHLDRHSLRNKTILVTGASRGIGLAIAKRAAQEGANIILLAKTAAPNPNLPGTLTSAATEVERAGGLAFAVTTDIRDDAAVLHAISAGAERFGGIDVLVNNASAISLTSTLDTPMKRVDLMYSVNVRGTYACTQACLPHLMQSAKQGRNPHILTLSPPLNMKPRWLAPHLAYTIAKYGMSMCTLGHAEELRSLGIGVNSLWPRTTIATAALRMVPGTDTARSRTPEIVADAAYLILTSDARVVTGNFFIDDAVLAAHGITDLTRYRINDEADMLDLDLFLDP